MRREGRRASLVVVDEEWETGVGGLDWRKKAGMVATVACVLC